MNTKMTPKDIKTLQFAFSALAAVLIIRLLIMPAIENGQELKSTTETAEAQAEEMRTLIADASDNEQRIEDVRAWMDENAAAYSEPMENQAIDELVTGLAVSHDLFPAALTIETAQDAIPAAYPYSTLGLEAAADEAEEASSDADDEDDADEEAAEDEETETASTFVAASATISVEGSESDIYDLLDDIEKNYPGILLCSYQIQENTYMDEDLNPIEELQATIELRIYMCYRPEI